MGKAGDAMSMFDGYYDHNIRNYRLRGPAAQRKWEIDQLVEIYKALKPLRVLEIGVMDCGTLNLWIKHAPPDCLLVGMDTKGFWSYCEPRDDCEIHDFIYNSHDEECLHRLQGFLDGDLLDFLFIDGDHTEAGATLDFEMYGPLVRPGGVIAFHDILDPAPHRNQDHIRVSRLWKRIQRAGYKTQELVANPEQAWGGIGVVYV